MPSQALNRLTEIHGNVLKDVIEIVSDSSTKSKMTLMRLLVVSLAAFWEAFHEDLCRETLVYHPNPPHDDANAFIEFKFHNPTPKNITTLYHYVLDITDITDCWWGNPLNKEGKSLTEFGQTIERMMDLRHDVAHGKWSLSISPKDCDEFLDTILHLAIRTDNKVHAFIQLL